MTNPDPESFLGRDFAHFSVVEKLGEGGMGIVYLAEQTEPVKRRVAVKIVKHGMDTREFVARFEHEAKAAAALNHPNTVTVYELGEHEGRRFIAMEHVEGLDLSRLLAAHDGPEAPLPLEVSLAVVSGVSARRWRKALRAVNQWRPDSLTKTECVSRPISESSP